jgi:hypothetical protein
MRKLTIGMTTLFVFLLFSSASVFADFLGKKQFITLAMGNDHKVSIEHVVTYDADTHEYEYWFKLTSHGSKSNFLQWTVLDRVFSSRFNFPSLFKLEPKKSYTYSFRSMEPPVKVRGKVNLFYAVENCETQKNFYEENGLMVSECNFFTYAGSEFNGALPPSFLEPL